jgi:phosphoribosylformimino-5-aminoimidazole carboxamide ribotide isomerase
MIIVPSIDLRGGKVVRLLKGDYDKQTTYDVDPLDVARSYRAAGAAWMHVVDLDGAKEGRPVQLNTIRSILAARTGLSVQVGGGVRGTADVDDLLEAGAARVVVGTAALENWDWFASLAHDPRYGGKLVLAVDAKDGVIATRGWTASSGRRAVDVAKLVRGWQLGALLYTDVAVDGTLAGPNVARTRELIAATDVPVIASGGVGHLDHIRGLLPINAWGVIVGRSLYEGKVDLAEAIRLTAA